MSFNQRIEQQLFVAATSVAASRRDQLALGSLLNQRPAGQLKLTPASPGPAAEASTIRRTRIWEIDGSFHCSIVGTCLATADLRTILDKLGIVQARSMSEHHLHRHGVSLAGQRDGAGKLLHKALDRRHQRVLRQFDQAKTESEVARLWDEAVQRGEIPGAYWSVLTHPATGEALMKRAFGEVHMLSHLVGAANRADIRRLRELEEENAELRAKSARQQDQLRDQITKRDHRIAELNAALAGVIAAAPNAAMTQPTPDETILTGLVASLERRLASTLGHQQRLAERLKSTEERLASALSVEGLAEKSAEAMRVELEALETALAMPANDATAEAIDGLRDQNLLYVGGKPGHVAGLRQIADRFSAHLLYHDGGIEDHGAQLAGLVSQANIVFFPVDCISHDAMHAIKRLSRQAGKPYIPLRSAGLGTFLATLRSRGGSNRHPQAAAF